MIPERMFALFAVWSLVLSSVTQGLIHLTTWWILRHQRNEARLGVELTRGEFWLGAKSIVRAVFDLLLAVIVTWQVYILNSTERIVLYVAVGIVTYITIYFRLRFLKEIRRESWEGNEEVNERQDTREVYGNITKPADPNDGILRNEWAQNVDQIRSCLANGVPVVLGIEWFQSFSQPERRGYEFWIGRNVPTDRIVGGHAICAYGVSDARQAIKLCNSWGTSYPLVWLPYDTLQRLLNGVQRGRGEATVIVDRPER